ncbi:MAG: hypothetical protein QXG00_08410 [Candidatus Woesearchaeota archaeon]
MEENNKNESIFFMGSLEDFITNTQIPNKLKEEAFNIIRYHRQLNEPDELNELNRKDDFCSCDESKQCLIHSKDCNDVIIKFLLDNTTIFEVFETIMSHIKIRDNKKRIVKNTILCMICVAFLAGYGFRCNESK